MNDSVYGFEGTINTIRDNYKHINSSIEALTNTSTNHSKRLDKIESEIQTMRDLETHMNTQINFLKENYLQKSVFEDQKFKMKDEYYKLHKDNEDLIKKL